MKKVLLFAMFLSILFGQATYSSAISCLELANMLREEMNNPDKLIQTYRAYGVAKCQNVDGDWLCFECVEGDARKILQIVRNPKTGLQEFKRYGCPCSKP